MKPLAFRIRDFKSIVDSGVCELSIDNITVLAGQNESGKTSILQALRDFDLIQGDSPATADFMPDDRYDAHPSVSVQFGYSFGDIERWVEEEGKVIPETVGAQMRKSPTLWVKRDLLTGMFSVDKDHKDYLDGWDMENLRLEQPPQPESEAADAEVDLPEGAKPSPPAIDRHDFMEVLHANWPAFVYFDTFEDILPRTVSVDSTLLRAKASASALTNDKVPQSVMDFVSLSQTDLELVKKLGDQDKSLGNYLSARAAHITGDFLNYWKQRGGGGQETVTLKVRHHRDPSGQLQLAFYVHDKSDQYPEQRSKGFLWFLSFYLRLAAADSRASKSGRLLLIDEPGTYLHARAQKDVLSLLENRLTKSNQIIYSTHSVYLLPANHLNRLRVVIRPAKNGTEIVDRLTDPRLRGSEFADTLSPIMNAIGLDVRDTLSIAKDRNLITEGLSDFYYLHAWSRLGKKGVSESCNIFPAAGAMSTSTIVSLFLGWGLEFIVLLDHDSNGDAAEVKLVSDLGVSKKLIVQPKDAAGIEDLFSAADFQSLLSAMDGSLVMKADEKPTTVIRRLKLDKILIARAFADLVDAGKTKLDAVSQGRIDQLFADISVMWPSTVAQHGTAEAKSTKVKTE